jgi:hypothetical protein
MRSANATHRQRSWLWIILALCSVAMLSACSTVATRIEEHKSFFSSLPAPVRARLSEGEVRLGDNQTMVYIAMGQPDERVLSTTADGELSVWHYRYYEPVYEGDVFIGYTHYLVGGRGTHARRIYLPEYRPVYRYEPREYFRVTFEANRVVQIDRLEQ